MIVLITLRILQCINVYRGTQRRGGPAIGKHLYQRGVGTPSLLTPCKLHRGWHQSVRLASHPGRSSNTPCYFKLWKLEISTSVMDYHPIQGGVVILLVTSCHGN